MLVKWIFIVLTKTEFQIAIATDQNYNKNFISWELYVDN